MTPRLHGTVMHMPLQRLVTGQAIQHCRAEHTIFSFHWIAVDHLVTALEAGIGNCVDIVHIVLSPVRV